MKPIYRYIFSMYLYRCAGKALRGYRAVNPQGDHSLQYEQVLGPFFRVYATEDCHTTGAPIGYADPLQFKIL